MLQLLEALKGTPATQEGQWVGGHVERGDVPKVVYHFFVWPLTLFAHDDNVGHHADNPVMTCVIHPFICSLGSLQVSAELLWTVPTDVAPDNNICALPLHPFFRVIAGKCQGTIGHAF